MCCRWSSVVNGRHNIMRRTVVMVLGIFIVMGIWFSTPAFAAITSSAEDAIAQESYDKRKPTLDIANKAAAKKGATLESLSKACGPMVVRIGSVLSGQAPLEKKLQKCLEDQLDLSSGTLNPLNAPPVRWNIGSIYRIHEATDVYAPAIQRWMNEHFGDTIMSAISFTVEVEEGKSHGQKTIRIIYEGKALGYSDDAYWTKE
ncbi:MAG: hypothetical protein EXR97_01665 [Nitrospiraceae bacterium]|nr:hypothetical protein [Nitrospiraceae bacterium]